MDVAQKWISQYRQIFGTYNFETDSAKTSHICRPSEAKSLAEKYGELAKLSARLVRGSVMDRKVWEWLWIADTLQTCGVLRQGKRGLGFACGKEPLVSFFAENGCEVKATDAPPPYWE
jgi:hypothetical protein